MMLEMALDLIIIQELGREYLVLEGADMAVSEMEGAL
jgi:hypothetical protein